MLTNATWIRALTPPQADEYTDYLLAFTAEQGRQYVLTLACDTNYALYEKETLLAFGQYSDYPDRRVADTLSLDALASGEKELILRVWYQGIDTLTAFAKPSGVIFELTEDGTPILVSSPAILSRASAGYRPHLCRRITSQLGLSFSYDASREAGMWASSVAVPLSCEIVPRPVKKLVLADRFAATLEQSGSYLPREGNTLGEYQQKALIAPSTRRAVLNGDAPITLTAAEGGVYVILDMGRETAGFVDLHFAVKTPCRVVGGWGEHLKDGRCRTAVRDFSFEYFAKAGENIFLHPFRRLGGRYLQLFFETDEVVLTYAGIRETFYPITLTRKPSGNLLRDRISEVCVNTLRQCMHEHYEDCPWREQALYTLDSRNQMLCGYAVFAETDFARASLDLISQGLRSDGLLSICYPAGIDLPIPSFSLAYFLEMRDYLDHTGDRAFLADKYPLLTALVSTFLDRRNDDGLVGNFDGAEHWNFYEWKESLDGNHEKHLVNDRNTVEAPLNAYLSLALQALSAIAAALGYEGDAEAYRKDAEVINTALAKQFYDSKASLFRSFSNRRFDEYSVLTNSLCLLCGAADGLEKEAILTILRTNGEENLGRTVVPNTLSMNAFRFDALLREDRERFAPVVLDELDRTYLYMLENGATSFWETLLGEADFDGAGSLCHGWTALPLHYYSILG